MLLRMSLSGGILILLIIVLRSLAVNRLPKRLFVLLWGIALIRLLLPVELPLPYGIASPAVDAVSLAGSRYDTSALTDVLVPEETAERLYRTSPDQPPAALSVNLAALVWLAGTVLLLLFFLILYIREYRRMQEALPVPREAEAAMRALAVIPDRVRLRMSDCISTPLAFGILSPKIVLSKVFKPVDEIQLKYVLTHELTHIRHGDNLWKILMLVTVCIHWFNPLVWAMYILFNRDLELSCDEKVISLMGENTKKDYAMTLVYLAEKQYHWSLFSNGFAKNTIQERIVAIMKFKKMTIISIAGAVLLTGTALTVFAQNNGTIGNNHVLMEESTPYHTVDHAEYIDRGKDGSTINLVTLEHSRYPAEYEAYGLYYDTEKEQFIYEGKRVGCLQDQIEDVTYIWKDRDGSIGIRILRDSDYQLTGVEALTRSDEAGLDDTLEEDLRNPGIDVFSTSTSPHEGITSSVVMKRK